MSDRSSAAGPIVGVLVIVVGVVLWVASLGHHPTTDQPTVTTRPTHHRQVTTTTDRGAELGAALGNWVRHITGGDHASPTTTTRPNHRP